MVPLGVFRSRQFSGANLVTFGVYGGFGATTFLVVVYLQTGSGYSPHRRRARRCSRSPR